VELEHRTPVAVLLTGAGKDPLPARVDTDDGTMLTLVLVLPPEQRAMPIPERRCSVEWTTRKGLHRVSGSVSSADPHPEVLHVVRDGDERVVQRRDAVRVEVVVDAVVTVVGAEARAETNTLNVSGAGLCIRDPLDLDLNAVIDVELLIEPEPMRARCVVVREVRPGEKGVRIYEIGPDDRHRLTRFVAERQRLELKVARERLG
jgi:hypothetical protein